VLRECHRVLEAGGRLAGYVIHTASGLSPAEELRAADLGPPDVLGFANPDEMAGAAGFSLITQLDVTDVFRTTCEVTLETREQLETELRDEEGDETYEDEQAKLRSMLTGIAEGLLQRSLSVAVRP
jgi:hypothetical protein